MLCRGSLAIKEAPLTLTECWENPPPLICFCMASQSVSQWISPADCLGLFDYSAACSVVLPSTRPQVQCLATMAAFGWRQQSFYTDDIKSNKIYFTRMPSWASWWNIDTLEKWHTQHDVITRRSSTSVVHLPVVLLRLLFFRKSFQLVVSRLSDYMIIWTHLSPPLYAKAHLVTVTEMRTKTGTHVKNLLNRLKVLEPISGLLQ